MSASQPDLIVKVFETWEAQVRGIRGEKFPLVPGVLYFFPRLPLSKLVVTTTGVPEKIRVYLLGENFEQSGGRWELPPEVSIVVPGGTRHLVETSMQTGLIRNFGFLRDYL